MSETKKILLVIQCNLEDTEAIAQFVNERGMQKGILQKVKTK